VNLPYLVGYTDRWALTAGDSVEVMLSAAADVVATADLVRLGVGEPGRDVDETVIETLGEVVVGTQRTTIGSCVRVPGAATLPDGPNVAALALTMPTRPARLQALMSQGPPGERWWLGLDPSGRPRVAVTTGDRTVEAVGTCALVAGAWYAVAGGSAADGGLVVAAVPLQPGPSWRTAPSIHIRRSIGRAAGGGLPRAGLRLVGSPLFIAAADDGAGRWSECFDGKIESPVLLRGPLDDATLDLLDRPEQLAGRRIAGWDLGLDRAGEGESPTSVRASTASTDPNDLGGECLNAPVRAVTGHRWCGVEQDFRLVADEYAAIHFHADDLDDCRWDRTLIVTVPAGAPSGVYAVRVTGAGCVDRLPLFVRPPAPSSDVALLIPTASYLAYANDHPASDGQMAEAVAGATPVLRPTDLLLHEHREWGLSCYDAHADGSGVVHSTRLRPMLNMRPTHRYHVGAWQFPADLAVVSWLGAQHIEFDVLTDDDLDRLGAALLVPYRTLITGTHPEYYSTAMLDGVERWLDGGGRLVYIGANGFYWRAAFDPQRPFLLELRRGHAGSRAWDSPPGEDHLAATGERGGLWRNLGRSPQKLTGVGYAAQGFDRCSPYRRLSASRDPRVAFIFDGVESDVFGTSGEIGGAAAGQEVDRLDTALGSPSDALLLATSDTLSDGYQRCVEEIGFTVPGTSTVFDPSVRADVVYHVRPGGGAVFATGSIAWSGSLAVDADVSRITANVIARFRDPTPLDW
jgi:N,N-dimethylformamidase